MSSATSLLTKLYAERGVQTDSLKTALPVPATSTHLHSPPSHLIGLGSPLESTPPSTDHLRSSTRFDTAYTHDSADLSFESMASSADRSMTTTTRAYKLQRIPANRPTTLANRQPSSRMVSLPESTPGFRMKSIMERKSTRVVSMPTAVIRDSRDASSDSIDAHEDTFTSEDAECSRVRVRSHATDVPHTPSAPSSPDSVVIIANNSNQLSRDFLRQRSDEEAPESDDGEGWITWAKSPPRPIPALHGPLSLPYARCPSGAEGTIIEEPDSLRRVIWGLDANESAPSRPLSKPLNSQSATFKPAVKVARDPVKVIVEIKPQDQKPPKIVHPQTVHLAALNGRTSLPHPSQSVPVTRAAAEQLPPPPEFMLKHSEPIDLGRLVNNEHAQQHRDLVHAVDRAYPGWQTPYSNGLPTPELVHDLSPELQAMLFAQERLRANGITPSTVYTNDLNGSISASSSSSSLLSSLKSSRSPIVLEELTYPYPYSGVSSNLAQKYRQQQLQQNLLPTPPNSSSPIWSSAFSPYQGALLSPELLAAAGLAQLNNNYLSSQTIPPRMDATQHLLRQNYANTMLEGRHANLTRLAPAANISVVAGSKLPPRLAAEYARRRSAPEDLEVNYPTASSYDLAASPSVPKAPPNTPHGRGAAFGLKRSDVTTQLSSMAPPASPSSPRNTPSVGLPQHLRSIPLSRLVQRRLSTVPEEDYAASADGRTPPPVTRAGSDASTGASSGLHLFLSSPGRTNDNTASLGLLGESLGRRYGMDDMGLCVDSARNITPSVKLPSIAKPASTGPISPDGPHLKEASRRQGSMNSDGGRRGESGRGRGQKRGGRGRKGRAGAFHGPGCAERVDGGLVVKS
ncbi:hypothetical protein C8Q80DRAFT_845625 [Daedaleopsis nitida]|nr:hypothetical protein C8Q80DRAFT_845625 [Daedaleopsis nitida]